MPARFLPILAALFSACTGKPDPSPRDDDHDGFDANEDCDDHDGFVYPDAPELCDEKDNDCDGAIDEDVTDFPKWLIDDDGDGYGGEAEDTGSCDEPPNAVDLGRGLRRRECGGVPGRPGDLRRHR